MKIIQKNKRGDSDLCPVVTAEREGLAQPARVQMEESP